MRASLGQLRRRLSVRWRHSYSPSVRSHWLSRSARPSCSASSRQGAEHSMAGSGTAAPEGIDLGAERPAVFFDLPERGTELIMDELFSNRRCSQVVIPPASRFLFANPARPVPHGRSTRAVLTPHWRPASSSCRRCSRQSDSCRASISPVRCSASLSRISSRVSSRATREILVALIPLGTNRSRRLSRRSHWSGDVATHQRPRSSAARNS